MVCLLLRMEAGVMSRVGHLNRVRYVKKDIRKRKSPRRIKSPAQAVPRSLQELFRSCLEVFKGPGTIPSSQDVQKICRILGTCVLDVMF